MDMNKYYNLLTLCRTILPMVSLFVLLGYVLYMVKKKLPQYRSTVIIICSVFVFNFVFYKIGDYYDQQFCMEFKSIMEEQTGMYLVSESSLYNFDKVWGTQEHTIDKPKMLSLDFVADEMTRIYPVKILLRDGYIYYYTPTETNGIYKKDKVMVLNLNNSVEEQ